MLNKYALHMNWKVVCFVSGSRPPGIQQRVIPVLKVMAVD